MKILGFVKEDNGGLSSIRLLATMMSICMTIDWMYSVFTVGKWSPDLELIALVLGVITAKVVQKPFEEKEAKI